VCYYLNQYILSQYIYKDKYKHLQKEKAQRELSKNFTQGPYFLSIFRAAKKSNIRQQQHSIIIYHFKEIVVRYPPLLTFASTGCSGSLPFAMGQKGIT
jgi:hypothetical protein